MSDHNHTVHFKFDPIKIEAKLTIEIKSDAAELKRLSTAASELDVTTEALQKAVEKSNQT